jgi:hypothetical protein
MIRNLIIAGAVVAAFSIPANAFADPVVCPGNLEWQPGPNKVCYNKNGKPTGAGWEQGTGNKL